MFKIGDFIKSKRSGKIAKIVDIEESNGSYLLDMNDERVWRTIDLNMVDLVTSFKTEESTGMCSHSFKTYVGFSSVFDYCVHCDLKRNT